MSKIMAVHVVLLVAAAVVPAIVPALGQTTDPKATDATGNGPPAFVITTDKENSSTQGQTSPTKDDKKKTAAERPIQGFVTNADGKPIVGAVVQLKNMRSLQVRSYITRDAGSYYFSGLNKDIDYEVKAQFNGKTSAARTLSSFDTKTEPVLNLQIK
jgi:Carboxypeptidase regulatory-like domain